MLLRRFLLAIIRLKMEHWGFKMKDYDKIFEEWLNSMRDPTPEEWDHINNYIKSISRPTGINIFDLIDEYEENQFDK